MSENETPGTVHTCAVTGEESGGKHYILRSTEGEELVSPDALFDGRSSDVLERHVKRLEVRVMRLEKLLVDQEAGKEQGDSEDQAADVKEAPAKKTAAKKTAAAEPTS
jgi:hypothetical protein